MDLSKAHLHWRVSRHNGKEYRSYSLARSFRENGKVHKEILHPLGKLSDKEVNEWKLFLKRLKGQNAPVATLDDIITEAHYAYLDVAVLLEIWHFWGLSKVFEGDSERQVPLWAVAAILTINRCVEPSSKSQVPAWFEGTALPYILGVDPAQINPSRIFRELSAIDHLKSNLCDYLYQEVTKRDPPSMEAVFYDLSSSTFSGTRCILMDWGYCKEGFENHVVLALIVNKKGLPVYWEVLPGCTADVTTIELLVRNLKGRFNVATTTMVFDRGMVSDENLILLENDQTKYISAMDRNQVANFADVKFSMFPGATAAEVLEAVLASNTFKMMNESTYYHEVKLESNGKRRYILCFNPQLCEDQKHAREQALVRLQSSVKTLNQELLNAKNSRVEKSSQNKFYNELSIEQKGFVKIKLKRKNISRENDKCQTKTISTYQGAIEIDEQKMQKAGQLDGFWMIVTNHVEADDNGVFKMSAEEVITPYKDKVVIESAFRDIKSFLDVSPIHVWTIDHVKAHYTICVLAYLLDRTLTLRLHEKPGSCSQDVVAHPKLYAELRKCLANRQKITGTGVEMVGLTKATAKQVELLERIDLKHLIQKDLVNKYFMNTGM